jgi:hypothetical protein
MQINRLMGVVGAIAGVVACSLSFTAHAASTALSVTVPSYFNSTGDTAKWNTLVSTAKKVSTTAILNPNDGPGTYQDANFTAIVTKLHASGAKVIGYISTQYGKRSLSAVAADINKYTAFYQVDGFFIDEMTSDSTTSHIQFYQSIYNYIKGLKSTYSVMANPGANMPELYASLPTADQFVVFEDNYKNYAKYQPASWQAAYPKSRFVHMVLNTTAAQMPGVVQYAKTHGAGSVFITDLKGNNPYKAMPSYWDNEAAAAVAP